MKSLSFVTVGAALVMLTSIQTFASDLSAHRRIYPSADRPTSSVTLLNDLKSPVKFKFSEDINLEPANNEGKVLSASVSVLNQTGPLLVIPGNSAVGGNDGCYIQKKLDNEEVRKAKVRAATNQWSIQLVSRKELKISDNMPIFTSVPPKLYREEFELQSSQGVKLQLICNKARCYESSRHTSEPRCADKITDSTYDLLDKLGVDLKVDIKELALQKSVRHDNFQKRMKSNQQNLTREATAQ